MHSKASAFFGNQSHAQAASFDHPVGKAGNKLVSLLGNAAKKRNQTTSTCSPLSAELCQV